MEGVGVLKFSTQTFLLIFVEGVGVLKFSTQTFFIDFCGGGRGFEV